jgi:hypothetical protein
LGGDEGDRSDGRLAICSGFTVNKPNVSWRKELQPAQGWIFDVFLDKFAGRLCDDYYPVDPVFVRTSGPISWQSSTAETPSKCADGESEVKTPGISLGRTALEVRPLFFSAGSMYAKRCSSSSGKHRRIIKLKNSTACFSPLSSVLGETPKKYLSTPGGQFGEGEHLSPSCEHVSFTFSASST